MREVESSGSHSSGLPHSGIPSRMPPQQGPELQSLILDHETRFEHVRKRFLSALASKDWEKFEFQLEAIKSDEGFSDREKRELLNSRLPKSGMTALHVFTTTGAPVKLFNSLIQAGADLSATVGAQMKDGSTIFSKCTALHLAMCNGYFRKAIILMEAEHPLNVPNGDGDDPVMMMLKHATLSAPQELRAAQAVGHYYQLGGLVNHRDATHRLALTYAVRSEHWKVARVVADELIKTDFAGAEIPVRKSEIQSSAVYASLRMAEPRELVSRLATLAQNAVSEDVFPTPPEQLAWMGILLDYIPSAERRDDGESWQPLRRVLTELKGHTDLFDTSVREALLNPRPEPVGVPEELPEDQLMIHQVLGIVDADYQDPATFLHRLVERNAPAEIFKDAVKLGARLDSTASIRVYDKSGLPMVLPGQTVPHQVAALGRASLLEALSELGEDFNRPDSEGRTPLHNFLDYNPIDSHQMLSLHQMLLAGGDPDLADNLGRDSFHRAERHTYRYILPLLFKHSSRSLEPEISSGKMYTIYKHGEPTQISHEDLVSELHQLGMERDSRTSIPADEAKMLVKVGLEELLTKEESFEASIGLPQFSRYYVNADMLKALAHPYHAYLFLRALGENESGSSEPEYAFTKLLPHLLFNHPVERSHSLARVLEGRMDSTRRRRTSEQSHPNAVELMALLNHPRDFERDSSSIGAFTSALTSITYFAGANRVATTGIADFWGKVGTYGFSGVLWRFDAERIHGVDEHGKHAIERPSLLQQYGMKALSPDAYGRSPIFGPSFLVVPGSKLSLRITENAKLHPETALFDEDTFIEMHRGCWVISHPRDGTLIVRNSSPVFGRDLLKEPGYYSPMGIAQTEQLFSYTPGDLVRINPAFIEDSVNNFKSVLSYEHFSRRRIGIAHDESADSLERMQNLLRRLHTWRTDYARWKFDTKRDTAWVLNESTDQVELAGGHLSPGFSSVVNYLELRFRDYQTDLMIHGESTKVLPDLAFVHPDYAPFSPYARMRVTEESLSVMRKLADGSPLTEREMEESQIHDFFDIGFQQDADLVFLAPEKRY